MASDHGWPGRLVTQFIPLEKALNFGGAAGPCCCTGDSGTIEECERIRENVCLIHKGNIPRQSCARWVGGCWSVLAGACSTAVVEQSIHSVCEIWADPKAARPRTHANGVLIVVLCQVVDRQTAVVILSGEVKALISVRRGPRAFY